MHPCPLLFEWELYQRLVIHGGCTFEGGKERAILREWRKQLRRSDTKSSDSTREEVDEGGSSFQWEEEGGGQEQWARMHLIMSASNGAIFQQKQ